MKNNIMSSLWIRVVVAVFFILLLAILLMGTVGYFLFVIGVFDVYHTRPSVPIMILLTLSLIVGTSLSIFFWYRILKPISELCNASKKIAKGDFSIRLKENSPIRDIHLMAENFNHMISDLSGMETLRKDFIANISHEFKTPLTAIEGYATLLQNPNLLEEEKSNYTQIIIESSRQLSTLTGNILKLTKIENQEIITDQVKFRLDEQIRKSILLLESEWSKKNITFNLELAKVTYFANRENMQQVWINLIGNSIKYSNKDQEVTVSLEKKENQIVVTISDCGIGMNETVVQHMFEKFYQGDTSRKAEGNGLGLALVKRIIDLCGGGISVESEQNKRTKIIVYLPLQ